MIVAVDDARLKLQRSPIFQPLPNLAQTGKIPSARPAHKFAGAFKLRPPAFDLPGEKILWPPQSRQANLHVVYPAQGRDPLDQGKPHSPPNGGVRCMQRRQSDGWVET